ncbi:MAG: hypothetical protein ACI83W_002437 [Marinoscillum sp.]|jgi:hypothetical protein
MVVKLPLVFTSLHKPADEDLFFKHQFQPFELSLITS